MAKAASSIAISAAEYGLSTRSQRKSANRRNLPQGLLAQRNAV
jgi:hypothetical protein